MPAGPAPGVTDDTIKVGSRTSTSSRWSVASLNHGDYAIAYQSLFDDINANGGINGRMIEAVIAPINPSGTEAAEAACLQLTQDEQVFAIMGFFQGDNVLCPLEAHQTMVIGGCDEPRAPGPGAGARGSRTRAAPTSRARSSAPSPRRASSTARSASSAAAAEEAQINDIILPLLDELGVEVAETAIADTRRRGRHRRRRTPPPRWSPSASGLPGVDQVLAVGASGLGWASGIEATDYRPQLLLTDPSSTQAYVNDEAGRDLTVLDGAIAGNLYGPAQSIWELPQMQECIQIVEAGGVPGPRTGDDRAGHGVPLHRRHDGLHRRGPVPRPGGGGRRRTSATSRWRRRRTGSRSSCRTSPSR